MIYIIIFAVLLTFTFIFDYSNKGTIRNQSVGAAYVISFVILTFLVGLRYRVGTDTLSYMDEYNKYPISYFKDKYLIGWYLFIALCKSLHLSFTFVQLVLAFFTNIAVFSFLKRYSRHLFSSILLYYVVVFPILNFEILRQAVCISIFLLTFSFLENKQYLKYYLYIGIACLFHYSALLLLFLPLITWIPFNRRTMRAFLVLLLIVMVLAPVLKNQIYQLSMGLSFLEDRAFYYFSEVDAEESFSAVSYIMNLTLNVVIPLCFIRFRLYSDRITGPFLIMCMFSIIIYLISLYMPIIYRLNNYFQLFSLVLFVDFFNWFRSRIRGKPFLVFFVCLLLFIGVKARLYFAQDENGTPVYYHYYPYSSVFNEFKVVQRERIN